MGFFERLFARKKPPQADPAHSPYILPGELGYPGDQPPRGAVPPDSRAPDSPVALAPPPPPPPPAVTATPPVDPAPAPVAAPAVTEAATAEPLVGVDARPKAVAHGPAIEHAEEHHLHDFVTPQGEPSAAWVILEDGTVAYLPGDPELKERMRYLADNLLPPVEDETGEPGVIGP